MVRKTCIAKDINDPGNARKGLYVTDMDTRNLIYVWSNIWSSIHKFDILVSTDIPRSLKSKSTLFQCSLCGYMFVKKNKSNFYDALANPSVKIFSLLMKVIKISEILLSFPVYFIGLKCAAEPQKSRWVLSFFLLFYSCK